LRSAVAASPGSRMLAIDATHQRHAPRLRGCARSRGLTDTCVVGSGPGSLRCATCRAGSSAPRLDRSHEPGHEPSDRIASDRDTCSGHDHRCPESCTSIRGPVAALLRALWEPGRRGLDTPAGRAQDVRVLLRLRLRPVLGRGRGFVPGVRRYGRKAGSRIHGGAARRDGEPAPA
jgi:hypothetical protein